MVYCYLKWTIWHLCVRIVNTKHESFTIVRWKCFNKIGWKLQNFNLCFVNIDVVFSVWYDDTWIFLCKEMNLLIVSRVLDTSCGLYLLWLYAKYNEDNVNHIQLIFLGHWMCDCKLNKNFIFGIYNCNQRVQIESFTMVEAKLRVFSIYCLYR
jgi:hypothetical protein